MNKTLIFIEYASKIVVSWDIANSNIDRNQRPLQMVLDCYIGLVLLLFLKKCSSADFYFISGVVIKFLSKRHLQCIVQQQRDMTFPVEQASM